MLSKACSLDRTGWTLAKKGTHTLSDSGAKSPHSMVCIFNALLVLRHVKKPFMGILNIQELVAKIP